MKKIQDEILRRGLDSFLFVTYENINPNLFYLTEYIGSGVLIVPSKGRAILHVPSRDLSIARKIENVDVSCGKKLSEMLSTKGFNFKKIGVDFANLSVKDFNFLKEKLNCELLDVTNFMNELRAIKGIDEIRKIKKACEITHEIIGRFADNFSKFKTENDVVAFLAYETRRLGCGLAFEPIVASGVNAAVPHHVSTGKIQKGFCVVDFGVKFEGYCSDITRTFYVGKPSIKDKKIYYSLLKAQEKAISMVKKGVSIKNICLKTEKMTGPMIHALGHGLGIEVHEFPHINKENKVRLKEGMVITIEPGIYVDNEYGIRIEDDVLVTKSGVEILSKFTKKLIILK